MAQLQTTAVTGSLTVTGQIVAQTLNVQQVTSSIIYSSGSNRFGNLTSDVQQFTGSLRVTGSGAHYIVGGNVGIGTVSPGVPFHIVNGAVTPTGGYSVIDLAIEGTSEAALGIIGTTYSSIYFGDAATALAGAIVYNHSNDALDFRTNGNVERMRITSAGDVGIGATSPSTFGGGGLTLGSTTTGKNLIINSSNAGNNGLIQFIDTAGNSALQIAATTTQQYFYGYGNRIMSFFTNESERVRITPSGSFLVGDVAVPSEGAWFGTGVFGKSGTNKVILGYLGSSTNGAVIGGHNSGLSAWAELNIAGTNLIFRSGETEYMRLATTGNVGIGTTSPGSKLTVIGDIATSTRVAADTINGYTGGSTPLTIQTGGAQNIIFGTNAVERARILTNGNVGINTTAPAARLQVSGSSDVLNVKGSGSLATSSLFSVDGAYGRLFEVSDDLTNSLFSVNTIAGLPVIEAFADYSVNLGTYSAASGSTMRVTGSRVGIGTTTPGTTLDVIGNIRAQSFTGSFSGSSAAPGSNTQVIFNSSGSLAASSGFVFTGASVGIGTASPVYRFEVSDGTRTGVFNPNSALDGFFIGTKEAKPLLLGTTDTERARINTSGNVGIGTTNPTSKIHVVGGGGNGTAQFTGTTYTTHINYGTNEDTYIRPGAAAGHVLIADIVGNVGIGTSVPAFKLDVSGSFRVALTASFNSVINVGTSGNMVINAGSAATPLIQQTTNYTQIYRSGGGVGLYLGGTGDPGNYYDNTTHYFRNLGGGTTHAIITSAGNVGIGTTNPGAKLDVLGGIQAAIIRTSDASTFYTTYQINSTTVVGYIGNGNGIVSGGGTSNFGVRSEADLLFAAGGNNERVRITSGGSVGIGTTTPTAQLHLSGSANIKTTNSSNTSGFEFGLLGGSADASGYVYQRGASSIIFGTNNTQRAILDVNGNIGIGATSPLTRLHVGPNVSDTSTYAFTNTAALIASLAVDQTAARTNVLALMRDGTSGVVYAGLAAFDMSRWSSDSVNARTQLDIRLANTDTGTLTDVLSLRSNGNVGIGITASAATLHVSGTTEGVFEVDGRFGVNALYVSASGNVGLGITTPGYKLHISGGSQYIEGGFGTNTSTAYTSANRLIFNNDYSDTARGPNKITLYDSTWLGGFGIHSATLAYYSGANHRWYQATTAINAVHLMTLDANANLGIGTTAPIYKLDVNGTFRSNALWTDGSAIGYWGNGSVPTAYGGLTWGAGYATVFSTSGNVLYFAAGSATPKMVIDTNGNVGINTTASSQPLQINGTQRSEFFGTDSSSPADVLNIVGTGTSRAFGTGSALVFSMPANTDGSNIWAQARILGSPDNGSNGNAEGAMFLQTRANYNPGVGGTWNWRTNMVLRANGNVGVGTSSPTLARLQVQGNIWALSITGSLQGTASYATQALSASYAPGGGGSQWTTNGTSIYYNTGNVGVGTTTPDAPLRIAGATNSTHSIFAGVDGRGLAIQTSLVAGTNDAGSILNARGVGAGTLIFQTDGTERVRIASDGKVGIATNSPTTAKLVFGGTAGEEGLDLATADQYANLRVLRNSLSGIDKDMYIGYQSGVGSKLHLFSNNTETITVSGGSVGIGTTAPNQKLDVVGRLKFRSDGSVSAGHWLTNSAGSEDVFVGLQGTTSVDSFGIYSGAAWRFTILNGGNVGIGTISPSAKLHISTSLNNALRIESDENSDSTPVVYIEGNKNGSAPYTATLVELRSNIDARGRGIHFTAGGTTNEWFTGVPYLGGGYQIGYDASGGLPFTTANSAMFIDTSRNVNIGTTSAGGKLTVDAGGTTYSIYAANQGLSWASGIRVQVTAAQSGYFIMSFVSGSQYGSLQAGDNIASRNIAMAHQGGNVGIGTTVPTRKLSVYDSSAYMSFNATAARTFTIGSDTLGFIVYDDTAASYRAVINANGNLGIGTTSPTINMHVVQSANTSVGFRSENANTGLDAFSVLQLGSNIASNQFANLSYASTGVAINGAFYPTGSTLAQYGNGGLNFLAAGTASPIRFFTGTGTGTLKMIVENGGNVGVGTSTPQGLFHVQGRTVISGSLNLSGSAVGIPEHMILALSDETTNITTGTAKVTFRAPFAMKLIQTPRASLSTASTSGLVTVDINEAGSSIFTTRITIDANELTSVTAATPAVLSDFLIADDAQITMDIDTAGTGARGLKVTLYYIRI